MSLKESGEMYLESIYILHKSKPSVRSIDVAEHMNFSRASVSRGMSLLKNQGFISVDKDGSITLTEKGYQTAGKIYERHTVISQMLTEIGVDEKTAAGGDRKSLTARRHQDLALGHGHCLQLVVPVPGAGDIFQVQGIPVAGRGKQSSAVVDQLTAVGISGGAAGYQSHG